MAEKTQVAARQLAVRLLQSVIDEGESLSTAMPKQLKQVDSAQDRAFCQMLVYGVLRHYWRLQALLAPLMKKPLKAKDHDIQLVLLLALYQLTETRVPDYAAVDAAVNQIRQSRKKWAAGMANGVLRNFIRQRDRLVQDTVMDEQAQYNHPQWFIDRVRQDWPQQWPSILQANNQQAPMVLRINRQQISVEQYVAELAAQDQVKDQVKGQAIALAEDALVLEQAADVNSLPGYEQGWFSVQDAGAQQAAGLLDCQADQKVLDCCAAPGGKTCHLLERQPSLAMTAVDISDARLMRVQDNLERLGLSAELLAGDASQPAAWWSGEAFDRILLDVPCSASGVVRRHPDIKSLRRAEDIAQLVILQQTIIDKIWPLLAPGGLMLYATCSVFKDENENQMTHFLQRTADAEEQVIEVSFGESRIHGRQILPGQDAMDGFYYCLLRKKI